jgi:hypothetical protein
MGAATGGFRVIPREVAGGEGYRWRDRSQREPNALGMKVRETLIRERWPGSREDCAADAGEEH